MQRVAQAKMAQTRALPQQQPPLRNPAQLNRPNLAARGNRVGAVVNKSAVQPKLRNVPVPAHSSGVVQPGCFSGIGAWFSSCWNSLWSSPRRDQYQELTNNTPSISSSSSSVPVVSSSGSSRVVVSAPVLRTSLVDEEDTVNHMTYPRTLNAGLITSCALVIFCWDDSLDCYHAKGGGYKENHRLRSNPSQIHYVYMALPTDDSRTIEEYRRNANLFRRLAGNNAPMTFRGQTDINRNILVDVHSMNDIRPKIGGWRM